MAQHTNVAEPIKRYTRADFTALRYKLNRLSVSAIRNLYTDDALEARGLATDSDLLRWVDELKDQLIERARLTSPHIAKILEDGRKSNTWSKAVVDFIIKVGESYKAQPLPEDSIGTWFKPVIARPLREEGIQTMADLKQTIERRGAGWYRPIPRIGPGKARALERWLSEYQASMGALTLLPEVTPANQVELRPDLSAAPVPLERIAHVTPALDGSLGRNRNQTFCLISARNDLQAIQAYLYRFRGKDKTLRAYQKELERFLLWCVKERHLPLSSVLTDDCEAYKDFLTQVPEAWLAPKLPRTSPRWRPFAGQLAPVSQRYAVQALRSFFEWLVRVRYLGGNPWATVADPVVEGKELVMDIDKALPEQLWQQLTAEGGILDRVCKQHDRTAFEQGALAPKHADTPGAQYRLAHATILLLGTTGLRREEAARATRNKLRPVPEASGRAQGLWELQVLGKRNKWRTVLMPERVIGALRAHWADRGHDFDLAQTTMALLSPVAVPRVAAAQLKHRQADFSGDTGLLSGAGFSPDGLYNLVKRTLMLLAQDTHETLSTEDRQILRQSAPHAFRHTFATRAAGKQVPLDVLQRLLGHASQQTTSIYVQAERARSIEEAARFFAQ